MRILAAAIVSFFVLAQSIFGAETPAEPAVRQVLVDQQAAWNAHDLEKFMAGYWNSPDLTFFSGAQRTAGWYEETLERKERQC